MTYYTNGQNRRTTTNYRVKCRGCPITNEAQETTYSNLCKANETIHYEPHEKSPPRHNS